MYSTPQDIGYTRFSSKKQAEGTSEIRQTDGFAAFHAASGRPLGPCYLDKGESAYWGIHREKEFGRLLADADKHAWPQGSVVWFEEMDRFGRGKTHIVLSDWHRIVDNGYKIHVSSLGTTFDANSTEMEMLGVIVKAILAHEESVKKSIRTRDNRKRLRESRKTKQGKRCAACPFWLTVGADGEYHENEYANLVRSMFTLAANGHGCGTIKKALNHPNRNGKAIDVLGVLRNRAAIGELEVMVRTGKNSRKPTGEVKQGYYPAVVDDKLFFKVQNDLAARTLQRGRKGTYVTNLFSGIIVSTDDKQPLHIKRESSGKVLLRRKTAGKGRTFLYSKIENALLTFLHELQLTPLTIQGEDWQARIDETERKIADVTALQSEYPSKANAIALANLETKLAEYQSKLETAKGTDTTDVILTDTQELIRQLETVQGDELLTLRTRIRGQVANLVAKIWLTIESTSVCTMKVIFKSGIERWIKIDGNEVKVTLNGDMAAFREFICEPRKAV